MLQDKYKPVLTCLVGIVGLALRLASDFVRLRGAEHSAFRAVGTAMYFVALFFAMRSGKRQVSSTSEKVAAICVISGAFLFAASLFIHTLPWVHKLLGTLSLSLLLICWSVPRSRWAEFSLVPIFIVTLFQIRWKDLATLASMPPSMMIGMVVVWALLSLLAFRLIDKRHIQPHVELN